MIFALEIIWNINDISVTSINALLLTVHFDFSLLWTVCGSVGRTKPKKSTEEENEKKEQYLQI